ncbi:hypothetical protein BCR44DRAFT_1439683 [Catenaria anguillulae PL171]|uniref:Uncharacterized protein n=1 Tax=Catenaria anguillulae PL171 TaxID=765915 RepID=A0A1Y2HG51_9FUNG|nr:hypothetical protein BCR44DRAFT_1439683 [Catenaria anguillulae PL171]
MPVHGLVCRTPSPALTHRLSFGSDTTVTSDTEPDFADADDMGGWIDIGAAESFESSMSYANGWVASPMRPSTATAMLREALALEWRDMLP